MMDIIKYIETLNWPTILAMFAIVWYFTHDIKSVLTKQGERIDDLYRMYAETQKEIKDIQKEIKDMHVITQKEIKDIYVILMNQKDKKDE